MRHIREFFYAFQIIILYGEVIKVPQKMDDNNKLWVIAKIVCAKILNNKIYNFVLYVLLEVVDNKIFQFFF